MGGRRWTEGEVQILKEKYPKCGSNIPELDRTQYAIQSKARNMEISYNMKNHIQIDNRLKEYLNGLLLGDGSLGTKKSGSIQYLHSDSSKEYLSWLKKKIEQLGLPCYDIHRSGSVFRMVSVATPDLRQMYQKWYFKGCKKIPENVDITPTILKNWYVGDGSYSKDSRCNSFKLEIGCYFDPLGKERLVNQINQESSIEAHNNKHRVYVTTKTHQTFFKYILSDEPAIPPSYEYKFAKRFI